MSKQKRTFFTVLLTIISITLAVSVTVITRTGKTATVFGLALSTTQIAGVLSITKIAVYVVQVLIGKKVGLIIDFCMWVIELTLMLFGLFIGGVLDTIPGMAQSVVSMTMIIIIYTFVRREEKNQEYLSRLSRVDYLTGLHNRRALIYKMNTYMKHGKEFYAAFITITNFREINDYSGHDYGDKILGEFAKRIMEMEKENEFTGRLGGAEFLLIIPSKRNDAEIEERVREYINVLSKTYNIGKAESYLICRAGIVKFPEDGEDERTLFRHMDATITFNRKDKDKAVSLFNASINYNLSESGALEERIIKGLTEDTLHFVYQPQFYTKSRRLRGFEALARLEDEDGTPIPPEKFIAVAERTNLIFEIDNRVLENTIKTFKPIVEFHPELIVSVNISARHFNQPDFSDFVRKILEKYRYPSACLEIEITETVFAERLDIVNECMCRLKELGVQIALDDFGTGYASLSYLTHLPVSVLKIDKSFIDKLNKSEMENDFVKAIIDMGHTLKLDVISEGVETEDQKETLLEFGCNMIQGYLWGRPVPFEEAVRFIGR